MEELEITSLINKCYKAVENSTVGQIVSKKEDDSYVINSIPWEVFKTVLGSQLPHISVTTTSLKQSGNIGMKIDEFPGDTWKKES